jgi:small subunit ribosomal protein S8
MMIDPTADMFSRIRNAGTANHRETVCPVSRMKRSIADVLQREGFLAGVREESREGHPVLVLAIRYGPEGRPLIGGLRRVSRPGRRVYVGSGKIPKVRNGLGVAVLSTSKGVLSDRDARSASVGGELLCEVW